VSERRKNPYAAVDKRLLPRGAKEYNLNMAYDESDAWEEASMDAIYEQVTSDPAVKEQFYEQFYDEIVKDFTDARLRSFYEREPAVVVPAVQALERARRFMDLDDTTACIHAGIAVDVGLNSALLKPIVYGLVHSETAAALITKLALKHYDENFGKILLDLLRDYGKVDPRAYKRAGVAQTLWEEIRTDRPKRNRVVHQGETASHDDATRGIAVAAAIVEDLFPTLVGNLGLHLHESIVCGVAHGRSN
jgi:hypothetical protein